MIKKLTGNIIKCHSCSSYLSYDASDIETKECSYGVQSYAGETYIGKFIVCPVCNNKIEIY